MKKRRKRAEGGRKGAMRAFTASQSDSDLSEQVAMEAGQDRAQELGAAAPAEEGDKKYFENQKERRERAKSHAKDREEKRKREEEKETHKISATTQRSTSISGSGRSF